MRLFVYNDNFEKIATIDGNYVSCLWSEGYNSMQNFSLELQSTEFYKKSIRPDFFVGRADRKSCMIIKSVDLNNDKIVATGKQATRALEDVSFVGTFDANTSLSHLSELWNASSKYKSVDIPVPSIDLTSNRQISNTSFLTLVSTLCQELDAGIRANRTDSGIAIDIYKPEENPNHVFSRNFGNMKDPSVTFSTENFKNYAIVLGGGEGENRTRAVLDQTNGEDKRELLIDARDLQQEDGESDSAYRERLLARGADKLLEHQKTLKCAFNILASDFGKRYDLGDVLTIKMSDFGLNLKARVTRFTEKSQNNQTVLTIDVGNITIWRI